MQQVVNEFIFYTLGRGEIAYTPTAMSKRTTILRRGRRFQAERRAIGGWAPVGDGARPATDARTYTRV